MKNLVCECCGKEIARNDQFEDMCNECVLIGAEEAAQMGPFGHTKELFVAIFNFEFSGAITELIWIFESAFGVGDYGQGGLFDQMVPGWRDRK
ncbi:hypothetical protein D3C87_278520 [compost metagenome]